MHWRLLLSVLLLSACTLAGLKPWPEPARTEAADVLEDQATPADQPSATAGMPAAQTTREDLTGDAPDRS
jgi:hypothetical protein